MIGCKQNPTWWDNIPTELKLGRSYHTTWQSNSGMAFKLLKLENGKALLGTKYSTKTFWSNLSELRNTNTHK